MTRQKAAATQLLEVIPLIIKARKRETQPIKTWKIPILITDRQETQSLLASATRIAQELPSDLHSRVVETLGSHDVGQWQEFAFELTAFLSADTETDTGKKKKHKKRIPSAASIACGRWVRSELRKDDTQSRKALVSQWVVDNKDVRQSVDGKPPSPSSIEKILQLNPDLWKPNGHDADK